MKLLSLRKLFVTVLLTGFALALAGSALAAQFTDVLPTAWYYADVEFAVEKELVNGKTATTYEPDAQLTAAEAVKLAAAMHQRNELGTVNLRNGTPWYQPYLNYAEDKGILQEVLDWDAPILRGQFMDLFAHAIPVTQLAGMNQVADEAIPDVSMSHPYSDSIYLLYRAGVLTGSDELRRALPGDTIKRSEVAAILTRMMDETRRVAFDLPEEEFMPAEELEVTVHPETVTAAMGDVLRFDVEVTGGTAPYAFRIDRSTDGGETYTEGSFDDPAISVDGAKASYEVTVETATYGQQMRFVIRDGATSYTVSNSFGVMLEAAVESEPEALEIPADGQPQDQVAQLGDVVTFSVRQTGGAEPYQYTWYKVGPIHEVVEEVPTSIFGVDTANLSVEVVDDRYSMQLYCVVEDANGAKVQSNVVQLVRPETVGALRFAVGDSEALKITEIPMGAVSEYKFSFEVYGGTAPYLYRLDAVEDGKNSGEIIHQVEDIGRSQSFRLSMEELKGYTEFALLVMDADGTIIQTTAVPLP